MERIKRSSYTKRTMDDEEIGCAKEGWEYKKRDYEESEFINHLNQYSESSVVQHLFAVWFVSRCRNFDF